MREYMLDGIRLHECVRAYAATSRIASLHQAVVVLMEHDPLHDRVVYVSASSGDVRLACIELNNMIAAAKVLRGIRLQ